MNFLSLIPFRIKLIVLAVLLTGFLGTAGYIHHKIDAAGYQRCEQETATAAQAAKDKALANLNTVEKHYAPRIKALQAAKVSDAPVGPLVTLAIDGM